MNHSTMSPVPILLIDDDPFPGLSKKRGGWPIPHIGPGALPVNITADPAKLFDLKWLATTQEVLIYRKVLWAAGESLSNEFLPLIVVADYQFNEEVEPVRNRCDSAALWESISPYRDTDLSREISSDVSRALRELQVADTSSRSSSPDHHEIELPNSEGCIAAGMIINDLREWPVVVVANTRHTRADMARQQLGVFELHAGLTATNQLRASNGQKLGWPQILPRASKQLRERIETAVVRGTLDLGWSDLAHLSSLDTSRDKPEDIGGLLMSTQSCTRRYAVRAMFMDVSDDKVVSQVAFWARELFAKRRGSNISSTSADWERERIAHEIVEKLWTERTTRRGEVTERFRLFYSRNADDDAGVGLIEGKNIRADKTCDVIAMIQQRGCSDKKELLRCIILLVIVRLLGLRSCANTVENDFARACVGAPLRPEDVYFALTPIAEGIATPSKVGDRWQKIARQIERDFGKTHLEELLVGSLAQSEKSLMRSYAASPVQLDTHWWRNDAQAKGIMGAP